MFDREIFAVRLKALREEKHLQRTVLAQLCGLHNNAISEYERCEARPAVASIASIADYFGVSVDYLLGRTDYRGICHRSA